ncbi:MAG: hypothetical protein LH610_09790 [Sphingomonas bacterium]|nr:hypothetical protein [Sphingomonas bacterium]
MNKLFYGDNLDVLCERGSVRGKKSDDLFMPPAIVEPIKRPCGTNGKHGYLV